MIYNIISIIILTNVLHSSLVLYAMNNNQEDLPLLLQRIGMTKKEFKKIKFKNIQGLIILIEATCCNPQSLQVLRSLIDLKKNFPLLESKELPFYRKDFVDIINLKIGNFSTIECSELLFSILACRHLDKACNTSSFIDEQTFDNIVAIIFKKTKKYHTEPLSLRICSLDASAVNKFVYTYNAFTALDKHISSKFSLLNALKKGINFFRKSNKQIALTKESIFKNILESIQQFGFITNRTVYLGNDPLMNIENVPYAKAVNRREYIMECLKIPEQFSMSSALKKRIITFWLCNQHQEKKHLKLPKLLIKACIIRKLYPYKTIRHFKNIFIKDIKRCKELNFSDGENGATDFLYKEFESWYDMEIKNDYESHYIQ